MDMSFEEVLNLIPHSLTSPEVMITIPNPRSSAAVLPFKVIPGETREDLAHRLIWECGETLEMEGAYWPLSEETARTLDELSASARFQAMFQSEFERELDHHFGRPVDVSFPAAAEFKLRQESGSVEGSFSGKIETPQFSGLTWGTLVLTTPTGLESVMDHGELKVVVEGLPGAG
jgi:hypothetical protein